ncbi:MAG: MFS transporter, partial [Deltaproteobacteria bacterium]|nr:MFS transporter [Deltaproteobacteria bacterium]
ILSMNYGSRYCFGVFVNPMFLEYQWSVSIISMGASINLLMYSTGGIVSGWLLDRMAPKWIMTVGAVITAVGFIMTSFIHTPAQLYLSYGVLCGLGSAGIGVVVSTSSVGKWFIRKRGVAIGISTMGIGFGTMALTPIAGYIVKNYEWRHGFIFFGILILLVGITVAQILMGRRNPEVYGLRPDGDDPRDPAVQGLNPDPSQIPGASVKAVFRSFRFWILVICFSAAVMTAMMAFVHQVSYAINNNIDKIIAASSIGVIGIASIFGRYFFGWFSDRLQDAKYSAFLGFLVMAAGMGILINTPSVTLLIVYAAVFGFGYGSLAPMMPVLVADRFGRYVLGAAYGWLLFFVGGVGGALGPLVGGLIYDSSGSY